METLQLHHIILIALTPSLKKNNNKICSLENIEIPCGELYYCIALEYKILV